MSGLNPKYPDIKVKLSDKDGNAFAIMGEVSNALRRAGHADQIKVFMAEAMMQRDYDNLLQTAMRWVDVT